MKDYGGALNPHHELRDGSGSLQITRRRVAWEKHIQRKGTLGGWGYGHTRATQGIMITKTYHSKEQQ
jgi:hypothetical protein